jgi:Tol biopolymer transport system component
VGPYGLKIDDALAIARQIALALEAAHARGIFHRDLKPANIKIAPDGVVKVLDFGIAKADEVASSAPQATAPRRTGTGVVLGTAAYMSPEQARGAPVDKRTDIWAFGCVLFEMLTGRRAFEADTFSDAIARILEREPDWSLLPPDVPDSIRRVLRRCLTKDPVDRLHDIADARLDIADASSPQTTTVPMVAGGSGRKPWLWMALALIPAAAIAVWSVLPRPDTSPASPRPVEFGISFPENLVPAHGVAVSPDGRYVAAGIYGAAGQVWLHSIETSDMRPVAGAERSSTPFWSPDSSHLAFFAGGALRKKNMASGLVSLICKVASVPYGGAWNSEGRIVFGAGGTLFQVSAAGGDASPLVLENQPQYAGFPQFLPGGRQFLFHSWGPGGGWVHVGSLASPTTKRLVDSSVAGAFGAPDRLLFVRGTTLLAQRLDLARLELVGEAESVAGSAGAGMLNLGSNLGALSASTNGVLAYAAERGGRPGRLTWFDRSGAAQASVQTVEDVEFLNPAISPTGELVAVNRMEPQTGNWDIWIVDVQRNVPTRLTFDPAVDADPVWSPDGREIVYTSDRGGRLGMYRQAIGSPDPPELLFTLEGGNTLIARDWTADGKYILFYEAGARPWSLWALPLSGERKPLLVHERAYGGHVSPDGAWVAYSTLGSGAFEVFVQRFPNAGAKQQISQGGGVHARWTSGGRELVYWTVPGGLSRVSVKASPSGLRVGTPRTIVQAPVLSLIDGRTHFDVAPDGRRFLVRQPAGPPGPGLKVIVNWTARLKP